MYSFLCTMIVSCKNTIKCSDQGTCGNDGTCVCNDNYYGIDCSSKLLFLLFDCLYIFLKCHSTTFEVDVTACILFSSLIVACEAATNCSGHGTCRADGTCECDSQFFAADCTSKL